MLGHVVLAALRALPTQLDLFTAVAGGGGVGVIMGGAVAWLLDEDLTQGGVLGGVLGMILGAVLAILQSGRPILVIMHQRLLLALILTVGVAFMLGFVASRGVLGPQGWAVALIGGAAICAGIGVALVPLSRRRRTRRLHLLRR